jgi:nicotinamidase-related amidase
LNPFARRGKKNNGHTLDSKSDDHPHGRGPDVREVCAMSVRLRPAESSLLVVDVQEKLLPAIAETPRLLLNISFLLDVARLLDVPALATEQYPSGLGRTAAVLSERLPAERPAKLDFSCCGVPDIVPRLRHGGRSTVVVCGIETHVCVLQTTLDLCDAGLTVAVAADAVGGRLALDHELALRRMERAGALVATCETIAFEWLGTAAAPQFKAISGLIRQRTRALTALPSSEPTHGS